MLRNLLCAIIVWCACVMSANPSSAQMPGDNPFDPGCNVNVGGNCGRQLDAWNRTWRRLGYPQEPGRGAYGTYLPGGGYVPNGAPGLGFNGYASNLRVYRGGRVTTVFWHRHGVARVYNAVSRAPAAAPTVNPVATAAANVGYIPPGIQLHRQ